MRTPEAMATVLIGKLTREEIHSLCEMFDDGSLPDVFEHYLIPINFRNYPEEYRPHSIDQEED